MWRFKYKPLYIPTYSSIRVYPSLFKCVPELQGGWHMGKVLRGSRRAFSGRAVCPRLLVGPLICEITDLVHVLSGAPVLFFKTDEIILGLSEGKPASMY